jgi:hypothetical protein
MRNRILINSVVFALALGMNAAVMAQGVSGSTGASGSTSAGASGSIGGGMSSPMSGNPIGSPPALTPQTGTPAQPGMQNPAVPGQRLNSSNGVTTPGVVGVPALTAPCSVATPAGGAQIGNC